ncbi:MAG TPA: transglutaminase-like domain-containing protein [Nitrososphaeraceae archaeon]
MRVQLVHDNTATFRKTEIHMCDVCGSTQTFPRYDKILSIAETRIGRCSEWAILFGAIVNSLSIQTRIVHDYLDHCWNESLIKRNGYILTQLWTILFLLTILTIMNKIGERSMSMY